MQFGSIATSICVYACITYLLLAYAKDSPMGIFHSTADFSKCFRTTFQGIGSSIVLVDCQFCDASQHISLEGIQSLETDFYDFFFSNSDQCLNSYGIGVPAFTDDCRYQSTGQQWKINGAANGTFQLQVRDEGTCLTYDSTQEVMVQATCDTNPQQTWIIEPLDNPIKILRNVGSSDKCLRYLDASADSFELEMVDCTIHDISQLVMSISDLDTGSSNGIRFVATDTCLSSSEVEGGTCIYLKKCADLPTQNWKPQANPDGTFSLKMADFCLSFDGTSLSLLGCNADDDSQRWSYTMAVIEPRDILLKNENTELCFSAGNNMEVQLSACDFNEEGQNVSPIGCGSRLGISKYEPVYVQSGELCLASAGGNEGSQVIQSTCDDLFVQKWLISYKDDGEIFKLQSDRYADFCVAAEENLNYMYLTSCQNATTQDLQLWSMMVTSAV